MSRLKINTKAIYVSILILFLLPRTFFLGPDISNSDALRWHNRSENFLSALKSWDLGSTYQRYHPGVMLMWIGAVSSQFLFWYQVKFLHEVQTYGDADFYPTAHGVSKTIHLFVIFICLVFQLYLARLLFRDKVSIIYGFVVAIEPYMIGINRWFHLTSLEAFFAFTSFLALLVFFKKQQCIFLVASAFFSAMGVLTKMTVLITVAFLALLLFIAYIRKIIKFKYLNIYALIFISSFFVFFPALWVNPIEVILRMYDALFNAVVSDIRGESLSAYAKVLYYPILLLIKSSPLLIIGGVYSLVKILRKGSVMHQIIAVYFIFLLLFLTFADQKIDRYVIAFFLPVLLMLSIALSDLNLRRMSVVVAFHMVFFLYVNICYYPIYSAYVNPLVGYKRVLDFGFYENSGEYYADAARYLNTKGRDIKVYAPNNIDSFKPYYKGKITEDLATADYIVYGLDFDRKTFPSFAGCRIEKYFGNRIYKPVVVYKCITPTLSFLGTD